MKALLEMLDREDLRDLGLIMVLVLILGRVLTTSHEQWSHRLAAIAFCAYVIRRWKQSTPYFAEDLMDIVLRAAVSAGLVYGLARIVLPPLGLLYASTLGKLWTGLRRFFRSLGDTPYQPPAPPPPEPVPTPPSPQERAQLLQAAADQARLDYETACQIIRSLGLSTDEQDAAVVEARQRLMRRLRDLLP